MNILLLPPSFTDFGLLKDFLKKPKILGPDFVIILFISIQTAIDRQTTSNIATDTLEENIEIKRIVTKSGPRNFWF
jgi:hypothetical protein